jgi:hypothetical protein
MKHQHQNNTSHQRQNSRNNVLSVNLQDNNWLKQRGNTPGEKSNYFDAVKEPANSTRLIMYNDDRDDR